LIWEELLKFYSEKDLALLPNEERKLKEYMNIFRELLSRAELITYMIQNLNPYNIKKALLVYAILLQREA